MYRIIIADDEEYVRSLLTKNINQSLEDFEVIATAENGEEAVELVESLKPDILITDILMPFLSGLELIRKIQEMNFPIKTVIISGYDDFNYAKQALTLGVTDYLLKPFLRKNYMKFWAKLRMKLNGKKLYLETLKR